MQSHHNSTRATVNDNNAVVITTSRMSGGVTLSPGSLTASQELSVGQDHANNNKHSHSHQTRFSRAESADRLMLKEYDHLRQRHSRVRAQYKKISAPTFSTGYISPHAHHRDRSECSLDESFRKILAKADNSINQAESILSSLKVERHDIGVAEKNDEDSEELASLGSDIESNIKRLEKTQAKINAALMTFRTVQALNETHGASEIMNQQNKQLKQLVKGRRAMRQVSNHRGFAANESNSYSNLPAVARYESLPSKMVLKTSLSSVRQAETAEKSREVGE